MNIFTKKLLHLSLISGVGPQTIKCLLDQFPNLEGYEHYSEYDLIKIGIKKSIAEKLILGLKDNSLLEKELELLEKHSFKLITFLDEDYPELLKAIELPPTVLYMQGTLPKKNALAIVGARKADYYGQEVIEMLVPELVQHQWAIISGGARGADTFAHQATLNAGGQTVAVLGSGLLQLYPYQNKKLFEKIVYEGGALVSSYPLRAEPLPENFPARNRIISGLSRGCIVVQAAKKSGAAITARFALDQGRDVFAVPGLISNPLSLGCHALIQEGAKIISNAQDILEEYGQRQSKSNSEEPVSNFSSDDQKILHWCTKGISTDDLATNLGLDSGDLAMKLFMLQVEGIITQNHAGLWERL